VRCALRGEDGEDALKHRRVVELAGRDACLELGAQSDQVPAQPVDLSRALGDEIRAVIGQQPDLKRLLVQIGSREAL
jgi:hypothetical protein